jgi:hypothetical protein
MVRYIQQSFTDDPALFTFYDIQTRLNTNYLNNFVQMAEDPVHPGVYLGIDTPEFGTHCSGQILSVEGPPTLNADLMRLTYITSPSTKNPADESDHTGLYRNPLPLSNGKLVAAHTTAKTEDHNSGTSSHPASLYDFRLKLLKKVGDYYEPDRALTPGIPADVSYFDPDTLVSFSGPMWELDPVEVRARPRPATIHSILPDPEKAIFDSVGVDVPGFKEFLRTNDLAVIVSRNLTTRDRADKEQPFNLRVAGTSTQTRNGTGKVYDIAHLQIYEGDQIRGVFNGTRAGRRVLAQLLHGRAAELNSSNDTPTPRVELGTDGSMAAFVPARRAMTWQLTDPSGNAVVRERYWLTFQPGEIRSCTSCHGINRQDQGGNPVPVNQPEALRTLLQRWKTQTGATDQIRIVSATRTLPGKFSIQAAGRQGQILVLQTSSNLKAWTSILTNVVDVTATVHWELDLSPAGGGSFFRLIGDSPSQ